VEASGFDHHAPGFQANLAQTYARLRRECPVAHSDLYGGFWTVAAYDDVVRLARDQAGFSSAFSVVVPPADVGLLPPLETDSPALDRYRRMLSPFLAPHAVRALEPEIRASVDTAFDAFAHRGRAELVAELANPVPAQTTMRLLGFDPAEWRVYAQPLHDASYAPPGSPEFFEALERIAEFGRRIEEEVDDRIDAPRADMVSALLADAPGGVPATRDEVVGLVRMTIFGGMDTVMAAMSNVVVRVGRDLELRRALQRDPALIPRAIEEMLRLDAPIQGFARRVTQDCTIGSQAVASGETVFLLWASANRDESVFDHPDAAVLDRPSNRHLTFGIGPHFCQGAALAREQLRIMLTALLERIPDFRLVDDEIVVPPTIGIANGFVSVPVEFEPAARGAGQCEGAPGS
jgi:cytochrome P450